VEDKHREEEEEEEEEHVRNEAPAAVPTATEADEEKVTQNAKGGIEIGCGTMDPAEELVTSTTIAGGGGGGSRDRQRRGAAEVAEPPGNGASDGKNPYLCGLMADSSSGTVIEWKNTAGSGFKLRIPALLLRPAAAGKEGGIL